MVRPLVLSSAARAAVVGAFALACTAFVPARAGADPLAVAAAVRGSVSVTAGKAAPQKVALGRTFERGDKVQVGPGGTVTLFFSDGNVVELGENSTLAVGGKVDGAASKTAVSSEVFAHVTRFVASNDKPSGMLAIAPMRGAEDHTVAMLMGPRHTGIRTTHPAVRWRSVQGAGRYKVTLSGDAGEVWSRETDSTAVEYPADAPALEAGGEYLCEVQAFGDAGPLRSDDASFRVIAAADAKQVDVDLAGIDKAASGASTAASLYMAGSYLVGRGLYDEALGKFLELARVTPDAPGPHEALGNVYKTIGLTDLAAAEFHRALELTRQ